MSFTITLRSAVVGLLWVVGIVLAILAATIRPSVGALAMAFTVGAATLSVLARIDAYAASWETAYEAGREVSKVRRMR